MKEVMSKAFKVVNIGVRASHLRVILHNLFRQGGRTYPDMDHLCAAMEWLARAQDATDCNGVSSGYLFHTGWGPAYPETTGYVIPTFLKYAAFCGDRSYTERAVAMGDWEIEIQLRSGSVRGGIGINEQPMVFNTGQVILGWASLFRETKLDRFLDAVRKAANWLVSVQDSDGKWSRYTYQNISHVYHTRVAWALLEVYGLTDHEEYKNAAERNTLWALTHAQENGWFSEMGFALDVAPFTHTVAYTLRGLIESSFYLSGEIKERVLDTIQKASENIMMRYELRESGPRSMPMFLPATLDKKWRSEDKYSCLTGNVQLAIVFLKLYDINNDARLLNTALKLIDQVKKTQFLTCRNSGIRGGIAGSYPIWGKYCRFSYPNWSTKFFADAIMLHESTISP